jgi:predicted transcriptional regulator
MSEIDETLITLTADIVAAHVSYNSVAVSDIPHLIANVHRGLAGLGTPAPSDFPPAEPAVSVRMSVKPDYIVCLDCGKKAKMLKRHLMTGHGLDPDRYKARWGLSFDYPLVAPNYAELRRGLAIKIGLGRKLGPKPATRRKIITDHKQITPA